MMWRPKILETEVVDNFKKTVIFNAAEQLLIQIDSDQAQDFKPDKTPAQSAKGGHKVPSLARELLVYDNCWKIVFLNDMTSGRPATLQGNPQIQE